MAIRVNTEYIVWHTAAHDGNRDTTAAEINQWHLDNGWTGIGYHYVVRQGGTIETGRDIGDQGAHVEGLNPKSLGICFSGHGDEAAFTRNQMNAGLELTRRLMRRYAIKPQCVIGHREVNDLIDAGVIAETYRTTKTCPGIQIDMDEVRRRLSRYCAFPIALGANTDVTSQSANAYYQHTERVCRGGYFPLGTNTVWHGGLHIHAEKGKKLVHACVAGELIAVRLRETTERGYGHYGSLNFILLKHNIDDATLKKANPGKEAEFATGSTKTCYSVYMHLNPEKIEDSNSALQSVKWLRTPKVTGYQSNIANLGLRQEADVSKPEISLAKGAEFKRLTPPNPAPADNNNWQYVEVTKNDNANIKKKGWIRAKSSWVKEIKSDAFNDDLAKKIKAGSVVTISRADAPMLVDVGDPLWTVGEYGSPGYRAGLIHWEIFSEDNLAPSWAQSVDTDENYNMDCREILNLVEQDYFGSDEILSKSEIERFYESNAAAEGLRRRACKFVIEWGINLDKALPALKGVWEKWRTGVLKERIQPYLWWDEAASQQVPLPGGKMVWHYNPVALLEAWSSA